MILAFPGHIADVVYALIAYECPDLCAEIVAVDSASKYATTRLCKLDARLRGQWNFGGHSVRFALHSLAAPEATVINAIPDIAAAVPPAPAIPAAAIEAHHAAFGMLGMFEGTAGGADVFEELEGSESSASANAQSQRGGRKRAPKGKRKAKLEDDAEYNPSKRRKGGDKGGNSGGGIGGHAVS
ncbi:hypothetical protein BDR26DRAFT_875218 [Obelidium mucronatum]|nr:hypothetical protein BDR26DRAFT_875218 [Obelidium mucronatum]